MRKASTLALAVLWASLMMTGCERAPSGVSNKTKLSKSPPSRNLHFAQLARGQAIYTRYCLKCHGEAGKGQVLDWRIRDADGHFPPPPLDDSAHAWHHPTAALLEVIREGSPAGQGKMPAWKDKLSEQEMQDVVVYIKSLWSEPVYRLWWNIERQSLEG